MADARRYQAMEKGDPEFRTLSYSISDFLRDVNMVIGVGFINESGEKRIIWTEQEVMYTGQAYGIVVRMDTPYGRKVVDIPLGAGLLQGVRMTNDIHARNRNEWWRGLKETWEGCAHKKIPNEPPVPYSRTMVCSYVVDTVELAEQGFYSDNYRIPYRPKTTETDLEWKDSSYKLHPDREIGSFYYKFQDMKVPVDYLSIPQDFMQAKII